MIKAKAYKVEIFFLDMEGSDPESLINHIENIKFIYPTVVSMESVEIDNWHDDHPLNKMDTFNEEYKRIFEK